MYNQEDIIQIMLIEKGFSLACKRFERAYRKDDPEKVYIPLFESLNWAVSLQDKITELWYRNWHRRYPYGYLIDGMRFVRNRVHHQWATALNYSNEAVILPYYFDKNLPLHEWVWVPSEKLPDGRQNKGRKEYDSYFSFKPARETVRTLHGVLGMASDDVLLGYSE